MMYHTYIELFESNEAQPKKPPSEAQIISITKARAQAIANRTCKSCGYVVAKKSEIAIIDLDGKVLFNSLVKTWTEISEEAFYVHGISADMLKASPSWGDIWPEIKKIITGKTIIAYNADFDVRMLLQSCQNRGIKDIPEIKSECLMESVKAEYVLDRWIKLSEAAGVYQSHRAVDDCQLCLKIIHSTSR